MSNKSEEFLYGHFRSEAELRAGVLLAQIISPILLIVGTVGNVLSVIVFTRKNMQKSASSKYLLGLSVADLIVLYVCLLREWIRYTFHYDVRTTGNWICKLHWWLYYATLDYSVWLLTTVTIVRIMSTSKPFSSQTRCLKRHTTLVLVSVCLSSLIINFHFLFGIELQYRTGETTHDSTCGPGSKNYDIFLNYVWHYVDLCTFSLIPFFILSISNVSIIYRVISKHRKVKRQLAASSVAPKQEKISSMTKLLLVLNFVFIVCTAPICVYLIGMEYWVPPDVPRRIQEEDPWCVVVTMLMYTNNTVNFILYSLSGSKFRQELKRLFIRKARLEPSVETDTSTERTSTSRIVLSKDWLLTEFLPRCMRR